MHSYTQIVEDLKTLGVEPGGTYLLRVSYKAIGKIEGGPKTFLEAVLEAVGSEGTVIMTAFPKKYVTQLRFFHRGKVFSKEKPPMPTTGAMPMIAVSLPQVKTSEKLEFPFVVIGKHSEYLTSNHTHDKTGYWLLREAIDKFDCKCLRIGGEVLFGSTHLSVEDVFTAKGEYIKKLRYGLYLNEQGRKVWYDTPNTVFCHNAFAKFSGRITASSKIYEGMVGNGYAIITSMRESYKEEVAIYNEDVHNLLCDDPNCLLCRTSFSFSDMSNWQFLCSQIKRLFTKEAKSAAVNIENVVLNMLFAKRS